MSASYPPDPWHTFYGRGVWPLGESGDEGVMIEGADRRSYAALNAFLRETDIHLVPYLADEKLVKPRRVRAFHDSCGCTPEQHERHDQDGRGVCLDCARFGLPPCDETFSWAPEFAADGAEGLPVLWGEW